jgi:hypothetical protein
MRTWRYMIAHYPTTFYAHRFDIQDISEIINTLVMQFTFTNITVYMMLYLSIF